LRAGEVKAVPKKTARSAKESFMVDDVVSVDVWLRG